MEGSIDASIWLWVAFNATVFGLLALDLGVFHRQAHAVSVKEAAGWTVTWVSLALTFNAAIYFLAGHEPGVAFFTGYLIELSLSVDNIFVFVLLFTYFAVPAAYQHRVLFWGILGVIVMRGTLIALGSVLIHQLHWVIYIFGAILILSAWRMATGGVSHQDPSTNPAVRFIRRFLPVTETYEGQRFFVRRDGVLMATPLMVVLAAVETTDLVFAIDSIPAIFAITHDPFLVYTSNLCAVMGLRSMYFLLAGVVGKFHYLQLGLSLVLAFVGTKMLLSEVYKIPVEVSLLVVASVISTAIAASLLFPKEPRLEHVAEKALPEEPAVGSH
ncbi:MAG TPA: TerC family protein [Dehalococcoidia bacterium]|nr:TerC family protein [Dehalococcoidia bacterium]